jgi:rhodanese-related sulfurtransferase
MKTKARLIVLITTIFLASLQQAFTQNQVAEINADTLNKWISEGRKVELIYVGTHGSYAEAHIPGSVFLPFNESFANGIKKMSGEKTYVLICPTGGRSYRAAELMTENGFSKVFNLRGGVTDWIRHGFKVVKSK